MLEILKEIDNNALVALNGSDSVYWHSVMWLVTKTTTWIPLFLSMLYVVIKNNNARRCLILLGLTALLVVATDQFSSGFCKPFFHRFRPSQEPSLDGLVDMANSYKGSLYGFISGHATNTFAIATYFSLIFRNRRTSIILFIWAMMSSYSRIYLGLHYPGDILAGAFSGTIIAILFYIIFNLLSRRFCVQKENYSSLFTSTGYWIKDFLLLYIVFFATFIFLVCAGLYYTYQH